MEITAQRITTVKGLIHPDWMSLQFGSPAHPTELMLRGAWDTEAQRDAGDPSCLWVYCSPLSAKQSRDVSRALPSNASSPIISLDRARQARYQQQFGNRLIIFSSSPWSEGAQLQQALAEKNLLVDPSATLEPFGVYYEECVRYRGQFIKDGLRIANENYLYSSGKRLSLSAGDEGDIRRWKYRQRYNQRHKGRRK